MLVDIGVDEILLCDSGFIDALLPDPQPIGLWDNCTRHAERMGGGGGLRESAVGLWDPGGPAARGPGWPLIWGGLPGAG